MSQCIRCQLEGAQWVRVHLDVDTFAELCNPCREIWKKRGIATTPAPSEPSVGFGSRPGAGTTGGPDAAAASTA